MIRPIRIDTVLNGFVVGVGCQTLVYTEVSAMLSDLQSYLHDPKATEKRILAGAINREHTLQQEVPYPEGQTTVGTIADCTVKSRY